MTLAAISQSPGASVGAAAVAICSADRALCDRLAALVGADASVAMVGVVADAAALTRLIEQRGADLVLADTPSAEQLRRWTRRHRATAFITLADVAQSAGLDLLRAGAHAVLARSADEADIAIAVAAVRRGLCVLPHQGLREPQPAAPAGGEPALTARELDVLGALADGLSNKAIARRLGISFHTVKFHVAAILAKLDADSRTEAVTKAAQLGLVML
jgi:DNA-binding NarL/FixJ family response regulator